MSVATPAIDNTQCSAQAIQREKAIAAAEQMACQCVQLGMHVETLPGCVASFVAKRFAQEVLGEDPVEIEKQLLQSQVADSERDLGVYDKTQPLHVGGDHPNLMYRGNALKRSKQWFQTVLTGFLIYLYTGFQYGVAQAQRHVSVVPVVERAVNSINTLFDLSMNHVIFTLYKDGTDCIGTHQDKLPTIGAGAKDFIIVLKLGKESRVFSLCKLKQPGHSTFPPPFFEKSIDPGSLVVMSPYDNEFSVAHGVPEVTCGQTSSLVIRHVTQWMSDSEYAAKLAACHKSKQGRDKKKLEKRKLHQLEQ